MSRILFLVSFLFFSGTMFGLSVTYTPSTLLCGNTEITGTFDCNFSGNVLLSISGGVELDEVSTVIQVINGVMVFNIIITSDDADPFTINGTVVSSDNSGCAPGSEPFSTSLGHDCTPAPANDLCAGAYPLTINYLTCNSSSYPTSNQTASGIVPSCGGSGYVDLWYEFVANGTDVTFEVVSFPGTIGYFAVYDGCGGNQEECMFLTSFGTTTMNVSGLTVGNTYKLQCLTLAGSSGGTQEICLYNSVTVAIEDIKLAVTNYTNYNTLSFTSSEEASIIEVERKINDELEFKTIGELEVTGDNDYSFDDRRIEELGTYHYRLKIYDNEGRDSYSNVVTTRNIHHGELELDVYPNPCTDNITFDIGSYNVDGKFSIEILSADLKTIKTVHDFQELNDRSLNVSDLNKGVYFARIRSEVENRVVKFIKI